jgi:hypothetical protein
LKSFYFFESNIFRTEKKEGGEIGTTFFVNNIFENFPVRLEVCHETKNHVADNPEYETNDRQPNEKTGGYFTCIFLHQPNREDFHVRSTPTTPPQIRSQNNIRKPLIL